jgi:F0F1-type ATP synthase membrane subunit c/vacuolar-type H+-ATPase subunit K
METRTTSWRWFLRPNELGWWMWLIIASGLAVGIAGYPSGFQVAIGISLAKAVFIVLKDRNVGSSAAQVRVAYLLLLMICFIPGLRWLYWVPLIGTLALVLCAYCLMARFLSLLPWNRAEAINARLLWHTFVDPPILPRSSEPSRGGCPGGVCSIEAQLGMASSRRDRDGKSLPLAPGQQSPLAEFGPRT